MTTKRDGELSRLIREATGAEVSPDTIASVRKQLREQVASRLPFPADDAALDRLCDDVIRDIDWLAVNDGQTVPVVKTKEA